jgi:cardiolipin synthase A/B
MGVILTHLEIVLGVLFIGIALIWVLQQRRSPQSALAWILFIFTLPYLGVPLFFLLGVRRSGARYDELTFAGRPASPPVHPLDDQLRRLGVPPAAPGHRLVLQTSSEAACAALKALVAEAEHSLDVVLYRLDADKYGVTFARALTDAAKRGVRVRLILDQIGTWRRPRRALWKLRQAGGEIHFFSPVPRLRATGRFNLRNHRKMVLVDGRKIWSGGRNVGATYLAAQDRPATWRDLSFTLEGPVLQHYGEVFEADWAKQTGTPAERAIPVPPVEGSDALVQLVPSGPDMRDDGLHDMLVHAIHTATERIWIATPYFLPTDQLFHALVSAARLGRDVRILVPARSNQRIADFARGAYLRELEEMGCRILRYTPGMMHAKAMLFDDVAVVGSANFDIRSMLLNFETSLMLYDADQVAVLEQWFTELESGCLEGTRPVRLPRRLAEATFRLGAPIL